MNLAENYWDLRIGKQLYGLQISGAVVLFIANPPRFSYLAAKLFFLVIS